MTSTCDFKLSPAKIHIMNRIRRDVQDLERFEEIVAILFEEGFGALLDRLDLLHHVPVVKRVMHHDRKGGPERLLKMFERLGPTFIKFGQVLAQRPDLIPERYVEELKKLEDDVPPFDPDKARKIIDEEVGLEKFHELEHEPMAAASIAQVHKGRLENGEKVVVKVRRPGIKEQIEKDLDIILYLAKKFDHSHSLGIDMAYKDVKQFANWTRQELDLKREGRNAQLIKKNLGDEDRIRIPEIHKELTTEKVLVMEYVNAVKCNNVEKMEEMGVDIHEIANIGIRAQLKQMFRDGFFHADPHPSNFLVDHRGNLVYIDFGMVGHLTKQKRRDMALMILHIYDEDVDSLANTLERIGYSKGEADVESLKPELEEEIVKLKNSTLEEQQIVESMASIAQKSVKHGIYMPNYFMIMGKGMSTMEGVGLQVVPEFDFEKNCRGVLEDILKRQYGPREMSHTLMVDMMENSDLISKFPTKINEFLEQRPSKIKVEKDQEKQSNLVPAALILGSAVMLAPVLSAENLLYLGLLELVAAAIILWHS